MRFSIVAQRSFRFAAASLVTIATVAFATGCEQASQPGSVEIGGKDARNKIQPGATQPAPGGEAPKPAPAAPGGQPAHNIKDRPGS
jgi:hypothetical protein